jgi:hypothetical protein
VFDEAHKTVHVMDAKFTRVEGRHDLQLATYASGVCYQLERAMAYSNRILKLYKMPYGSDGPTPVGETPAFLPETAVVHVAAPRLALFHAEQWPAEGLVTRTTEAIKALYERIQDPLTMPSPNGYTCPNCAHVARCPAVNGSMLLAGHLLELPDAGALALKRDLTPCERGMIQVLGKILGNWRTAWSDANCAHVAAGGEIEGYRLMRRSTGTRVPADNIPEAVEVLIAAGIPADVLARSGSISLPELAKSLKELSWPGCDTVESARKYLEEDLLADLSVTGHTEYLMRSSRKTRDEDLFLELAREAGYTSRPARQMEMPLLPFAPPAAGERSGV